MTHAPSTAADMRSACFKMKQKGFTVGSFAKPPSYQKDDRYEHLANKLFKVINITDASMEIAEWVDGVQKEGANSAVDSMTVLRSWRPVEKAQQIVNVSGACMPSDHVGFGEEASKAACMLALRAKSNKHCKSQSAKGVQLLENPNAVKTTAAFKAGELVRQWLPP